MKKIIEVEIDVPDFIDNEFVELLSYLTDAEISYLKAVATGMLLGSGRLSSEQLCAIAEK